MIPRILVDDTAELGQARVFVVQTVAPRFFAEVVDESEGTTLAGAEIAAGRGQIVTRIVWVDPQPAPDWPGWGELSYALSEALEAHDAVRGAS